MSNPIETLRLDPESVNSSPARPLAGVVRSGQPTLDKPYVDDNGVIEVARWIYAGTSGNLSYTRFDDTVETLPNLAAGVWHPICSKQMNSSGTTIDAENLRWGS